MSIPIAPVTPRCTFRRPGCDKTRLPRGAHGPHLPRRLDRRAYVRHAIPGDSHELTGALNPPRRARAPFRRNPPALLARGPVRSLVHSYAGRLSPLLRNARFECRERARPVRQPLGYLRSAAVESNRQPSRPAPRYVNRYGRAADQTADFDIRRHIG